MADESLAVHTDDGVPVPLKGLRRDPEITQRRLQHWLAPRVGAGADFSVSPFTLPGGTGVANETLLFEATWTLGGKERHEGFAARLATERPLYLDADIGVHARIYETLADVPDVPVPRVFGYEPDPGLLGAPFFVMERMIGEVPGDAPHWRTAGFVHSATPQQRRAMWKDAVRVLAALHQVDSSLFDFLSPDGASGLAAHLSYWKRSLDLATPVERHEVLDAGYTFLLEHMPNPAPTAFSWGDSRFANIMFRGGKVVSIFDWDTASMAGAEADLAWWRFMDGPSAELDGIGGPDELVETWEQHTGRKVQHLDWHDVFTTFRLGIIMIRLFSNMVADGHMDPADAVKQGWESAPVQTLAAQLELLG